jgi:VIT1/CCC1 family predicted Fe2+/Mn2+ transporter
LKESKDMHLERHSIEKVGWLRAAVLGANDGIVSTASLVLGVASANTSSSGVLLAGVAGLVSGAMSMATGEYVSVSSQADTENAAHSGKRELETDYEGEMQELTSLYIQRGLDPVLAYRVAEQLMARNALDAHAREELGLTDTNCTALQAASCSEFFCWCRVTFNSCMVISSNRFFCLLSFPPFTGGPWLYILCCR